MLNEHVNGVEITPDNLHGVRPDGLSSNRNRSQKWAPFEFSNCELDCHTEEYKALAQRIKDNGDTAVGLEWFVATGAPYTELAVVWYQNIFPVEGLVVDIDVVNLAGDVVQPVVAGLDLGVADLDCADGCDCPQDAEDTFVRVRYDPADDANFFGRCDLPRIRITVQAEPEGGILGNECGESKLLLEGAIGYNGFCNRVGGSSPCGDVSCLGRCTEGDLAA